MIRPMLEMDDIQGDILEGLQKNAENFIFFKILNGAFFQQVIKHRLAAGITSATDVHHQELTVWRRQELRTGARQSFYGLNLGFTKDGLTGLMKERKRQLDTSFERGADDPETIAALHDPPKSRWLSNFISDRIDGVFLVTGPDRSSVNSRSDALLTYFGSSIKIVYSEIGSVRPGMERGHEHFGFLDGISNPGIRGLTKVTDSWRSPDEGLPGQDLLWPGEFVFGYPGQHLTDPHKPGPEPPMAAPWMRNGSYMVFRRLEQKVPEFWRFVREQAARLGMHPELLAGRMVGRWKSGTPLELAPMRDDAALGRDDKRNNNFGFGDDRFQRKCPYAAHIRKVYPRDDIAEAEAQRHRIIRAGIPFGPEIEPGETTTRHSRGLMFICYQTSIERQFEYIQRHYANNPDFVDGKERPGGGGVVTPGYDPIIGQAPGSGVRRMDEPYPNSPAGSRRTTLEMPSQFVQLTAAAYFFMPSISALHTELTA